MRMYATRKGWPLHHVSVRLRHDRIQSKDCADCSNSSGTLTRIRQDIRLDGPLTAEQQQALMSIADRCPVHRVLRSETVIDIHAVDLLAAPIPP
ncbi:MAG TPA: OsmC family protein [Nakamurella sp.]